VKPILQKFYQENNDLHAAEMKKNATLCFQMPWFACGSNEEKCNFVSLDADSPDPVCWNDGRSWGNG